MVDWKHIQDEISRHTGSPFRILDRQGVGGGCINAAWRINDGESACFVKTNRANRVSMFAAEAAALDELFQADEIKVPEPICHGVSGQESYFVMSWLGLSGSPPIQQFGRQMAGLHRHTRRQFGFHVDNTIGSTPQSNPWTDDWIDFWRKHRLGYQLDLARQNGYGRRLNDLGLQLMDKIPLFFQTYKPVPSLLHGDLWSGNWGADEQGRPVIFDPASYYGDREADLAMMELFGHPGGQFFAAYNEVYALDEGYAVRKDLYNLYHILNHANMFGSSYAMQAERMMQSLLAELS